MSYSDEELLKYCDGVLEPARADRLRKAARHNADLAASIQALEASRLPYRAAYAKIGSPPVPDELKNQVHEWTAISRSEPLRQSPSGFRYQARLMIAASIIGSFGIGFLVADQLNGQSTVLQVANGQQLAPVDPGSMRDWVERVADYQSLYVAETVGTVTGDRENAEAMLAGIANNTGLKTGIPDLSTHGYEFVRAQQLGYQGEVLVQLVYLKKGKTPLAICYMPSDSTADSLPLHDTFHGLGATYWSWGNQQFVIVADESEVEMKKLYDNAQQHWL